MKNKTFVRNSMFISLSLFLAVVEADDYIAEADFFGESPVVLTVSRMNKPLQDSPASVSVIDRQMIRNSGARQIADIFRMVPGILVGYHYGHTPVVSYQGLGIEWQRQLQVLIDGRSVFIPSFGGIPWSNLPLLLEDIERVEITRGPNAVTYGSNAFLATINIITRNSAEDLGAKISLLHDFDKDSETKDLYLRFGNHYGDLDWKLSAGLQKDDGYDVRNDSKLLKILNIRTDFLTSFNQFWTVQAGINNSTFGRGDGTVTNLFRDEYTSNYYQNLKWELIQDKATTTVKLSHTTQDLENNFESDRLNEELDNRFHVTLFSLIPDDIITDINFDRKSDRTDLEVYQNREIINNTNLVYGASIRKDAVKSLYLFNDKDTHKITAKRLFSSLEWKSDNDFIIDLGFMYEDTSFVDKGLSSRLSLIQKFDSNHSLRLVSSRAKRNPVLYEIIGDTQFSFNLPDIPDALAPLVPPSILALDEIPVIVWSADNEIEPESINSSEIGLFSKYFNRQLSTDIKIFNYKISDLIYDAGSLSSEYPAGIPQTFKSVSNDGNVYVKGIEASFNYSPNHKNYRLYGGFSRPRIDSSHDNINDSYPELTAYLGGHINFKSAHQFSASIYYVDKMSWLDNSTLLDDHIKLDARYQYTVNSKYNTQLEVIGYNLYEDFNEYVKSGQQKKSFLMRLSSRF